MLSNTSRKCGTNTTIVRYFCLVCLISSTFVRSERTRTLDFKLHFVAFIVDIQFSQMESRDEIVLQIERVVNIV